MAELSTNRIETAWHCVSTELPDDIGTYVNRAIDLKRLNTLMGQYEWPEYSEEEFARFTKAARAVIAVCSTDGRSKQLYGVSLLQELAPRMAVLTNTIIDKNRADHAFDALLNCGAEVAENMGYSNVYVRADLGLPNAEQIYTEEWRFERVNPDHTNSPLFRIEEY